MLLRSSDIQYDENGNGRRSVELIQLLIHIHSLKFYLNLCSFKLLKLKSRKATLHFFGHEKKTTIDKIFSNFLIFSVLLNYLIFSTRCNLVWTCSEQSYYFLSSSLKDIAENSLSLFYRKSKPTNPSSATEGF